MGLMDGGFAGGMGGCVVWVRWVPDSLAFGLVRGAGAFAAVLPSFVLVSRIPFARRYRVNATSFSGASCSRREAMVGGALSRVSAFRVGLGVGGAVIVPGLRACPSHSCDGWVCGWVRWAPPWYLGWYVGPGLSLRCFRLLF